MLVDDGDGGQISDSLMVSVFDAAGLWADVWGGQLRMSQGSDCGRGESTISLPLPEFGALSLCVNRWNGAARVADDCGRSEVVMTTRGQDTLSVCVNRWNGVLRVSDSCNRSERQDWL